MGIGTKIQSTLGLKHDQINTDLIAHHLELGMKWTLAESSVQFSLSIYVIAGWSNHPFYEWVWDGENNTIYDLSSNHCFAYRGEITCRSLWILMAVNQCCTDEKPMGLDKACQRLFQVSQWKWVYGHSFHCGLGKMKSSHFFSLFLFFSGTHSLSTLISFGQCFRIQTQFLGSWIDSSCTKLTQLKI